MSLWLADFNQHLIIAGFRDVRIKDIERFFQTVKTKTRGACVQFFDASLIASLEHLQFAALNALTAFKSGVSISNNVAMEMLLYSSAQRQIREAVKIMGIGSSARNVAVAVLAENELSASEVMATVSELLGGRRDDAVIELTDSKMADLKRLFNISQAELDVKTEHRGRGFEKKAIVELVIEHMALLVTQR